MKKLTSQTLFEEKTNVGVQATTTFNAPGNYLAPYGKTTVYISGKGSPGNYASGGNVAGSNQYYNSPTYAPAYNNSYVAYNPAVYTPAYNNSYSYYNSGYYSPAVYTPAQPASPATSAYYVDQYTTYWCGYTAHNGGTNYSSAPAACSGYYASYYNTDMFTPSPGNNIYVVNYTTITVSGGSPASPASYTPCSYTPGNLVYVPGNYVPASYTPSTPYNVPGNYVPAAYTPGTLVPGNPNYNPYVLGSSSSPSNVLGVTFPGGSACATAPTVSCTSTTVAYISGGTSVSVPPGGYITIKNV